MSNEKRTGLTQSQLGIYLECTNASKHSDYLIPVNYRFKNDEIDAKMLASAFDRVAGSFSSFGTVINTENSVPYMTAYEGELPSVEVFNCAESDVKALKEALLTPFSFDGSLLWRARIFVSETHVYLSLVIHHTVFDGTSLGVFSRALDAAYSGGELSETDTLFDAKSAEDALFSSEERRDADEYYETYLDGADSDSNIMPDKAGDDCVFDSSDYSSDIDENALSAFAAENGVTANVVFLSAFSYALSKMNNQKTVVFSTVESGRFGGNYGTSIGMFVKTFPLRFTIDEQANSIAFVKGVKENYFSSLKHNKTAFSSVAEKHPGLADVKYVYQGNILQYPTIGGTVPEMNVLDTVRPASNLEIMVYKKGECHRIWFGYRSDLYTKGLIDSFVTLWCQSLREIIAGKRHCDFVLVTEKSRAFIDKVNSNEDPYDKNVTIGELFDKAAAKYPENVAVYYNGRKITYKELLSLTDRLATFIKSKGLGDGDAIPVLIPRNEYMPVCALGIVKAGAAYEPLDPTYPAERLNFMVGDCEAKLLIADRSLRPLLQDYTGDVLYTDEIDTLPEGGHVTCDKPDSAFVLIYTSGTTGTPKGCIIENRNVVALGHAHAKNVNLSEKSHIATIASFGFDAAVMDIFPTLTCGGSLYVIPDEIKLDIPTVEKFYCENGITNGFMTTQLARMFLLQTKCPTLGYFVFGGEKLVPFTPPAGVKCINGYGPSEALAYVCRHVITDNSTVQPIGTPHDNVKLYIMDEYARLLPAGCAGELCISGPQVARGYRNRPEKNAEVFILNPFDAADGYERLYKTGDTVRMLPNGNFDFIGRRDGQVKIRGFRVELTEIEQVVREYPGIKNATVQAYDDGNTGKFIACFVVSDEKINIDELNSFIGAQKPAYMIPAVTVQIDAIPVNANGKVDKRKLPKPERKFEDATPPENEKQKVIFDAVCDIIGTREFGIDTDLFLAGLSSIGSIRLCSVLAEKFDRSVQINDIHKNNTVRKLETLFAEKKTESARMVLPDYPLTKTQQGILAECMARPDSTVYNIPLLLKLSEKVDLDRLKKAIVNTVNAHPYLKTVLFTDKNGEVRQKRCDDAEFSVADIETKSGEPDSTAVAPFELTGSRLFRFRVYSGSATYLFIEIHHIIADGTSMNVIVSDIQKAYGGEELTPEIYSSFDLALDEELRSRTSLLADARSYYADLLDGLDMNFLPLGDRLPGAQKSDGHVFLTENGVTFAQISAYCDKNRLSVNGLLCSVFGFVLAKYAGTDYSVFNTIYNGRNDSRVMSSVGMLVKTLPVVCHVDKSDSAEIASEVSAQLIGSMSNDLFSFAEIAREFGVKSDTIFVYQGDNFSFDRFCGEKSEEIRLDLEESKMPVSFETSVKDGALCYNCEYSPELYTEEFIRCFILAYGKALTEFVNGTCVPDISILTDEVREKMDRFNETELEYDTTLTIPVMFREQAQKHPDTLCQVYKEKSFTFGDAFDLSLRIAAHLKRNGIGRGDRVAILIHRDENMVLCAHGALMSGAAYVGLDPTYPPDRLSFMISDSGSRFVICDRKLRDLIKDYNGNILYTDEILTLPDGQGYTASLDEIKPEDPALIVYSSGTTGVPKGSVLTHGSIVCFCENYRRDDELGVGSNTAMYASFGFDGGAQDVLCNPMTGGSLYVIPTEIRLDIEKLEQFYVRNKITNGFMTTQVGTMFISSTKCRTLKYFTVGGEKFIPVLPPEGVTLYNGYGPSECMCYVNIYKACDTGALQPIGKTNRNIKEYIVDKYGNRLPFGACGELCVSGGQMGAGYLNRPEKTAESFVKNPFNDKAPYDRMYRTGDVVRELPDGNYDFVGRRDGQVKIRGFRVELSEIEQVIREFEGIKTATVQAYDAPSGGKYIAAYVVSDKEIDIDALNAFISSTKPDYMVPAITMQIDAISLTSNGKVDKKKLPVPEKKAAKKGSEPENETEEALCAIFSEVLGLNKVYADDDFFAIGGSSITAIRVVVKCNNAGFDIVFKNLFANPTPRALADYISHSKVEEPAVPTPAKEEKKTAECEALWYNKTEFVDEITGSDLGDVLLTGTTGFLGSHILRELIDNSSSNVYCLVRGKADMDAETRFRMMMTYYFEDWYTDEKAARVTVVDGDIEDVDTFESVRKLHFDTIINSAANVKHFAAGDELLRSNFSGVENLIDLAEQTGAMLVQISSLSVSGEAAGTDVPEDYMFRECDLDIGQSLENRYVYSKYLAEKAVIEAVSAHRIRAKIIRLGNLMARIDDSEFQINAGSSAFLKQFTAYKQLGMFPVGQMDKRIEFSPIDSTARAVVLLSGTPEKFTVFHARNCNAIHYGYFISAMNREGLNVRTVSDKTFSEVYNKALGDENHLEDFSTLIAYKDNSRAGISHQIDSDDSFTVKALYRLGFAWPLISDKYLEKMVKTLIELGFFSK